jgi:putative transposase
MGNYRQIYYQIVFGTKHWEPTISGENCTDLYKYIWGVVQAKKCKLFQINGVEDHIHIFSDLHPTISLSSYVQDIKVASSIWMKANGLFPQFEGWQEGYSAFTYNIRDRDMIINYVRNQKEHHKTESSKDEFRRLLRENGIEFEEKYLF